MYLFSTGIRISGRENAAYNNVKIYKKAETAYIRTVSAFLFHDFFTFYKIRSV